MGSAPRCGRHCVAVFPERPLPPPVVYRPYGYPEDRADAPSYDREPMGSAGKASSSADSAPAPSAAPSERAAGTAQAKRSERPGLGTAFGEQHASAVTTVPFERASATPAALISVRYNDRQGLIALGIDVDGNRRAENDLWLRETAQPFGHGGFAQPPPSWNR